MIKNKSPSIAELINILYSVIEENRNTLSVRDIEILNITIQKLKEVSPRKNANSKSETLISIGRIVINLLDHFLENDAIGKINKIL